MAGLSGLRHSGVHRRTIAPPARTLGSKQPPRRSYVAVLRILFRGCSVPNPMNSLMSTVQPDDAKGPAEGLLVDWKETNPSDLFSASELAECRTPSAWWQFEEVLP